jgi:hypothetical protein
MGGDTPFTYFSAAIDNCKIKARNSRWKGAVSAVPQACFSPGPPWLKPFEVPIYFAGLKPGASTEVGGHFLCSGQ